MPTTRSPAMRRRSGPATRTSTARRRIRSLADDRRRRVLLVRYMVEPRRVVAGGIELEHCDVGHEPCRGRSVPVLLPRLEEHTVAGPDHLDRPTTALCVTDALENVDRLAVRVRVPRGACARCEVDAARAEPRPVGR